jgi:hypothetical protein
MSVYDYESVWGSPEKNWKRVDFQKTQICTATLVSSWISMVASFIFVVFAIVTRSELWSSLAIVATLSWIGAGIAYVRIRRNMRKYIQVIE